MIKDRMETRTLTEDDFRRLIRLMDEYGSIAYAMDRAQAYIAAAKRELEPVRRQYGSNEPSRWPPITW